MKNESRSGRVWAGFATAAAALLLQSCAVVAVGAAVGTIAFIKGELVSYVPGTIYETVEATKTAVLDLGLQPVKQRGDASKAVMVATDPLGRRVTIKLKPERPNVTQVKIRVGALGDEIYSRRIFNQIESRAGSLGTDSTVYPPSQPYEPPPTTGFRTY